jgi:hypothetical protein
MVEIQPKYNLRPRDRNITTAQPKKILSINKANEEAQPTAETHNAKTRAAETQTVETKTVETKATQTNKSEKREIENPTREARIGNRKFQFREQD